MIKKTHDICIRNANIAEIVRLSKQLPEFTNPHEAEVYEKRLEKVPNLLLVAEINEQIAGFKVGYERDGNFYSWMGGVLPNFRRMGVALALAEAQEGWARENDYEYVVFKTRNSHKKMLQFALGRGFDIIDFLLREPLEDSRILLRKKL